MHRFGLKALHLLRKPSIAIFVAVTAVALFFGVTSASAQSASNDATLGNLVLSGIDFSAFNSVTTSYTLSIPSKVANTLVEATPNHSGASYVVRLDGVADSDRFVSLAAGNNVITAVVTAEDGQTTKTYTLTVTRPDPATDADLTSLTLRVSGTQQNIDIGTFDSATTSYTASVPNSATQTGVFVSMSGSRATYMIFADGVRHTDGPVPLNVGVTRIEVRILAEDQQTTKTYTVTVTRAEAEQNPDSNDATLSNLTLSDIDFGAFDSETTSYAVSVANSVTQTTVTPTLNHSGASYVIKFNDATDSDGAISLAVGSNVIKVVITAEDGFTTKTYTATVTRTAPPLTDATLSNLVLSGIDFGTFDPATTSYVVSVPNRVSQTTVTPTLNDSSASYVIKRNGATDDDGTVSLAVGYNYVTVRVTAADGDTAKNYVVTVIHLETPLPDMGVQSTDDPQVNFRVTRKKHRSVTLAWSVPNGRGITTHELQRYYHDGTEYVPTGSDGPSSGETTPGNEYTVTSAYADPVTHYKFVLTLKNDSDTAVIVASVTATTLPEPDRDATLSNFTLSGIDFGTFNPVTMSYVVSVPNSVTQTTVTPTLNDADATYVIKRNGVTDSDGTVSLAVGQNIITAEVTAEDDVTTKTYTVTVTRLASSLLSTYDTNGDGQISITEVSTALDDYFGGHLTLAEVSAVIDLYFSS